MRSPSNLRTERSIATLPPPVPRRPDMPPLHREALAEDPIEQFAEWYEAAVREVPLADAMTLATVDAEGAPDARMVLLKGFGRDGFRFFTNLDSAKARQLEAAPRAALVVYWRELDRQVRIKGRVRELPDPEADEYFAGRARDSQIGAWASPQSQPLPDRASLDARAREAEERFAGSDVARPPFWGGFLVVPREIEFWQGQAARLHDRFRYLRTEEAWRLERLAP
jgi:pyridoxamine 5'-phosphate oxidase